MVKLRRRQHPCENKEADAPLREDNPNVVSFLLILLGANIYLNKCFSLVTAKFRPLIYYNLAISLTDWRSQTINFITETYIALNGY